MGKANEGATVLLAFTKEADGTFSVCGLDGEIRRFASLPVAAEAFAHEAEFFDLEVRGFFGAVDGEVAHVA
ncbi:MAG: hypothetical protein EBR82_56830 [Caulobacteraceae bacterium]|nr:hypothetical protein [Caulobacteraceae bacterium]